MKESVLLEYRMNGMMINSSTTEDDDYCVQMLWY